MHTIKTYIKKVKLVNPITLFKNWFLADIKQLFAELNNDLSNRVDKLENVNDFGDIEQRLEDIEYYDLYDIQERAENAERKAEDNDNWIESIKERSETNQESIKNLKNNFMQFHEEYCELNDAVGKRLLEDFKAIKNRFETLESETSTKKIREIVSEVLCDEGLQLNKLDERVAKLESDKDNLFIAGTLDTMDDLCDRVDNLEELAKKDIKKPEFITESSLSAMQKLTFEICKYYGGDFNLDDFNNCYEIINKYNVEEGK